MRLVRESSNSKTTLARHIQRAQSLVEMAIALPILLMVLAGTAEIGNLFIQNNRAANISRETTRFVAQGGDDNDALAVSLQSAQSAFGGQLIAFDPGRANVYVFHGTVNGAGTAILDDGDLDNCSSETDFCESHIYPSANYFSTCAPDCAPDLPHSGWTSAQVFERINDSGVASGDLADLQLVAVVVQYRTTTLIPLPLFGQTDGGILLDKITVMRQEATIADVAGTPTQGCAAYPISVRADSLSVFGRTFDDAFADEDFSVTLDTADPSSANEFAFLLWNNDDLTGGLDTRLAESLGESQAPPTGNTDDVDFGYINPGDPTDLSINKSDPILVNTGPGGSADAQVNRHISDDRHIRILAHDAYAGGQVTISDVLIVELEGWDGATLDFQLVRVDGSCGN